LPRASGCDHADPDPDEFWHDRGHARDVLTAAEARTQLSRLIDGIAAEPELTVEIGRQQRRAVVMMSAERYDGMLERDELVRDLAWAAFVAGRIENPTSPRVTWAENRHRSPEC
jgi:PHD/YefM family antitoxin component YafN of YafNO toxin-antitoxin module